MSPGGTPTGGEHEEAVRHDPVLQLAEQLDQLVTTVGRMVEATADRFDQLQAEQAELRDDLLALTHRLESVTRLVATAGLIGPRAVPADPGPPDDQLDREPDRREGDR